MDIESVVGLLANLRRVILEDVGRTLVKRYEIVDSLYVMYRCSHVSKNSKERCAFLPSMVF